MLPDTASSSHACFVPNAKLNLLLLFPGPAELLCPDEAAIPKAKPWALIDGSDIPLYAHGTLRLGSATPFWRVSFPWCRSCSFAQADGPPASMSGFIQVVLAGLSPWSSTVLSQYTILIPQVCFGVNSNSSPLAVPSQNGCRKKPETIELLFWNRYTDKAPDTQKY